MKPSLTEKQHREIGLRLYRVWQELEQLEAEVADRYGYHHSAADKARKARGMVTLLRAAMENQFVGGATNVETEQLRVYWPGCTAQGHAIVEQVHSVYNDGNAL